MYITPAQDPKQLSRDPLGSSRGLSMAPLGPSGDPCGLSGDPQGHSRELYVPRLHFINFALVFVAFGAIWSQKYQYFIRRMHICQNYVALPAVSWGGGPQFCRESITFFANVALARATATFCVCFLASRAG